MTTPHGSNDADKPTAPPAGVLLWTAEQTAYVLSVTPNTVRGLYRGGGLRGVMVGRYLRFRPADVRTYVDALEPAP